MPIVVLLKTMSCHAGKRVLTDIIMYLIDVAGRTWNMSHAVLLLKLLFYLLCMCLYFFEYTHVDGVGLMILFSVLSLVDSQEPIEISR